MQYATKDYTDLLKEHHVKISMTAQGTLEENSVVETSPQRYSYCCDGRVFTYQQRRT